MCILHYGNEFYCFAYANKSLAKSSLGDEAGLHVDLEIQEAGWWFHRFQIQFIGLRIRATKEEVSK